MASEQDIINTLIAEALGQGEEGMRLVGETILNRSAIRGLTPEQVVRQPAQYTGYSNPGPAARAAQSDPNAVSAAQAAWALAQGADDPTRGADHYYAPGTISQPSWARGMQPTMQGGGHNFYSSQPVPRRAPVAPTPAQMSAAGGALRQVTSPSGGNTNLQAALNQYAIREGNRVTPMTMQGTATTVAQIPTTGQGPSNRVVQSRSIAGPSVADAARRAALSMGGNQTFAGQERAPVSSVPVTANSSSAAARRAALSIGGNQSFAGQERGQVVASVPGPASAPKTAERLMPSSAVPLGFNPSATGAAVQSGGLSRDALARQASYNATALNPPTQAVQPVQTAPLPPMPVRRPMTPRPQAVAPVQAVQQQRPAMLNAQPAQAQSMALARAPLNVLVQGSNTFQPQQPAQPQVGTVLGVAPNGGVMIQGSNGVMNTTTQNSDAWKRATGQSGYGSGQSNDTRYESYF